MEIFNSGAHGAAAGILSTIRLWIVIYLGNAGVNVRPKSLKCQLWQYCLSRIRTKLRIVFPRETRPDFFHISKWAWSPPPREIFSFSDITEQTSGELILIVKIHRPNKSMLSLFARSARIRQDSAGRFDHQQHNRQPCYLGRFSLVLQRCKDVPARTVPRHAQSVHQRSPDPRADHTVFLTFANTFDLLNLFRSVASGYDTQLCCDVTSKALQAALNKLVFGVNMLGSSFAPL